MYIDDETKTMEMIYKAVRQEGLQEGLQKAHLLAIQNLINSTGWDTSFAMDMLKIPPSQRATLYAALSKIN